MTMTHEKIGRNEPCPCGSGRKFKHCCLRTQPVPEYRLSLWAKQHEAFEQLSSALMSYAEDRFGEEVHEAWLDFNMGDDGGTESKSEMMIFMPYFLFHWDPEFSSRQRKPFQGGVVARAFLRDRGYTLSELQRTIMVQNMANPFSFYRLLESTPGECIALVDVLTGTQSEVVERTASRTLRAGDIMYGSLCPLPGITVLGCCAPIALPPERTADVIKLRKKLQRRVAKQNRKLADQDLLRYADDIRELYLDVRDDLHSPPRFANTDGERIELHAMKFRIESPELAFHALAPLAGVILSGDDLLTHAEFSSNGKLRRVNIPWVRKESRKKSTPDNTILGNIQIDGASLVAVVNSTQRAETLRFEIVQRLGAAAEYQSTDITTQEELRQKASERELGAQSADDAEDAALCDPEAQRQLREMMQRQVEAWVHKKLPVLGGRTPLQAVNDPDGREIVQSLLIGWERNMAKMPTQVQPDLGVLRRLLNLLP
jgi:hypothetical protein